MDREVGRHGNGAGEGDMEVKGGKSTWKGRLGDMETGQATWKGEGWGQAT